MLIVHTTCPDLDSAQRIAQALVERRLAACVSRGAPVASTYRWQGKVETADEVPLAIKTTRERYPALEAALRELHPYELPEIVACVAETGYGPYLRWVADETAPSLRA